MKLLHTGDLHLDSAFADAGARTAGARRESQRALLRRIFACAGREACDLILIAGDLFDTPVVTPETAAEVIRLVSAAGCPVVVAPGNHDPYAPGSFYKRTDLPENLYVFTSEELQRFDFEELGVAVYGYAFTGNALARRPLAEAAEPQEEPGVLRLLCAHGEYGVPASRYAPVMEQDLLRFGFVYAALGHIHNPPPQTRAGNTVVQYCGFGEGRSFDELGPGGVILAEISGDGRVRTERRNLSERTYLSDSLNVSGCATRDEVLERIGLSVSRAAENPGTTLRLRLYGTAAGECVPSEGTVRELYGGRLDGLFLEDDTVPYADGGQLSRDITVRGEFYRRLLPLLSSEDEQVRRRATMALRYGLSALDGRDIL